VRYLDFAKVRDVERKKAKELFGTAEEPTDLASKVCLLTYVATAQIRHMLTFIPDHGRQVQRLRCPLVCQWRRRLEQGPHLHGRREEAHASRHSQC
jgi:hypothetical protein